MTVRDMKRYLREQNLKYPSGTFVSIPREQWPNADSKRISVYRSREFLVQVFNEGLLTRLSISRTDVNSDGTWRDGITWDELQNIKNRCGFADRDAVEAYPRQGDEVNVANIRHLWIVPKDWASFFWRKGGAK